MPVSWVGWGRPLQSVLHGSQAPSQPLPPCSVSPSALVTSLRPAPDLTKLRKAAWPECELSLSVPWVCKTSEGLATLLTSSCAELTFCRPGLVQPRVCCMWETAPTVTGPCTGQLGDRNSEHQGPLPPHPLAQGGRLAAHCPLAGTPAVASRPTM